MCFTGMSREGCRWMICCQWCVFTGRGRGRAVVATDWAVVVGVLRGRSAGEGRGGEGRGGEGRGGEGRGGEGRGGEGRGGKSKFAILNSSCNVAILNAIKCAW